MGAVVSLGGCTASFVSPDGLHRHQPSLRHGRAAVQLDAPARPADERLPREDPRGRVVERPGLARLRHDQGHRRDRGDHRRARSDAHRPAALRRHRPPAEGARRGMREAGAAVQRRRRSSRAASTSRSHSSRSATSAWSTRRHEGIGVFGGETDNWRWPRHTGDWSYLSRLRRQGRQAGHATPRTTCPTSPKHWLTVAAEGVKPDDLVFVVGYPGRTQRHQTHAEVKETTEWSMPRSIRFAEEQLAILDALSKKDKAIAIKVAGRVQGLNNGLTNTQGRPGRPRQGRQPGAQAAAGAGARGVDRRRPRTEAEVRRRAAGDAGAAARVAEDARAQRHARLAPERVVLPRRRADHLPPLAAAPEA